MGTLPRVASAAAARCSAAAALCPASSAALPAACSISSICPRRCSSRADSISFAVCQALRRSRRRSVRPRARFSVVLNQAPCYHVSADVIPWTIRLRFFSVSAELSNAVTCQLSCLASSAVWPRLTARNAVTLKPRLSSVQCWCDRSAIAPRQAILDRSASVICNPCNPRGPNEPNGCGAKDASTHVSDAHTHTLRCVLSSSRLLASVAAPAAAARPATVPVVGSRRRATASTVRGPQPCLWPLVIPPGRVHCSGTLTTPSVPSPGLLPARCRVYRSRSTRWFPALLSRHGRLSATRASPLLGCASTIAVHSWAP